MLIAEFIYKDNDHITNEEDRRNAMLSIYRASNGSELADAVGSLPFDVQVDLANYIE